MMVVMSLRRSDRPDYEEAREATERGLHEANQALARARSVGVEIDRINRTNGFVQMFTRLLRPA